MSDRRPSKYWLSPREGIVYRALRDGQLGDLEQVARDVITDLHGAGQLAESDPVAVVRRGVESGTIKGEVGWWCLTHLNGVVQRDTFPPDTCWSFNADADSCLLVDATVVIGPVSDGGEDRP